MRAPAVIAILCALFLVAACGDSESVQQPQQSEILWETPDLPGPYKLTLDGVEVPEIVVQEFLVPDWNRYFLSQVHEPGEVSAEQLAEITAGFYSDPNTLFAPLLRDLLLVRQHEESRGDVNKVAFARFVQEFDANAGGTRSILVERLGEDGLREHLQRRFRLREMMKEFNAGTGGVSEEEIQQYFDSQKERVLADMMANSSVSQEKAEEMLTLEDSRLRELIENQLLQAKIEESIDAWIATIADVTEVGFTGPDGQPQSLSVLGPQE